MDALFATGSARCFEMGRENIAALQRFFEANPEYALAVEGEPPGAHAAAEEYDSLPPPEWPLGRKWMLAFRDHDENMVAMADVLSDLFVPGVWHVGLFIVATRLHGGGMAYELYDALESWMKGGGAQWARLGVVAGNARAEKFWERLGYVEVRRRLGVQMGRRTHDVRVMVKPLAGGRFAQYLSLVARDRPDKT
jgi:GNAT superfamily N-acetyltransferase